MKFFQGLSFLRNRHFLSLTGNGIMAVFGLFANMMLFRMLTKAEMGNWVIYQLVFVFIDSFRSGFLQTALIKFYSGADATRRKEIAGATWYIASCITLIFLMLNLIALTGINYISNISVVLALKWFGTTLLFALPYNIAFWILQAEQRFGTILYIRVINQGCFILCILGLYFFAYVSLKTVIISFILSAGIASLVCLVTGWSGLSAFRHRTKKSIADVFHFGKYSVGSFISTTLLRTSDSFIINIFLGPAAVAVYNLPARLLEIIEILIRSLAATGMSSMSVAANQNNMAEVVQVIKRYSGLITIVLIPVITICVMLAPYLVLILGGGKYLDSSSANVFRVLVLIALFFPLDRFLGIGLDIIHKPQLNFIKVLIMLIVNISGDILGIYLFGNIYGVAISTIFTLAAGITFSYVMLKKHINIDLKGFMRTGYHEMMTLTNGITGKFFP